MGSEISIAVGEKFGRWTVIGPEDKTLKDRRVPCECECGTRKNVLSSHLRRGISKSCRCMANEMFAERYRTHGQTNTKLFKVWMSMKQRCIDENHSSYPKYGGRGIQICQEWRESYESFWSWSNLNGYADGLQIDRIDNNGHYEPSNCRWVTRLVNANNKRNNVFLTAFGETKTIAEWSRDDRSVVNSKLVLSRILGLKWPVEDALLTPVIPHGYTRDATN